MRTDHNIHKSLFQVLHSLLLFCTCSEPTKQVHSHRKILHPLHKGIIVLLRQNRGRNQINDLLSLLHRLEGSSDGNFRLAVSHITADQAIHNLAALHILLSSRNCSKLILRLLKGKHFLKFLLPDCVLSVLETIFLLTDGIKLHQILCHLSCCLPDLTLGFIPFLGSKFVQFGTFCVCRCIFLDHIKTGCQNIEIPAIPIFYLDIILDNLLHLYLFNSPVDSKPMIFMNHIIPDLQFIEIINLSPFIGFFLFLLLFIGTENIAFGDHCKFKKGILEAP